MWRILDEWRDDYERSFGMRDDDVEEAYKEGCRHGYEKAMRKMQGGEMGYRNDGGSRSGGYSGSDMANAACRGISRNILCTVSVMECRPTVTKWANADADAPTVSFIDNGGVECPSFSKSE
jgi:hypothetical protein